MKDMAKDETMKPRLCVISMGFGVRVFPASPVLSEVSIPSCPRPKSTIGDTTNADSELQMDRPVPASPQNQRASINSSQGAVDFTNPRVVR